MYWSHALLVRLVQGARDLDAVPQRGLERQRPPLQPIRQRLAFQVLHDQVVDSFLVADVV